jgi:hypothetical protein
LVAVLESLCFLFGSVVFCFGWFTKLQFIQKKKKKKTKSKSVHPYNQQIRKMNYQKGGPNFADSGSNTGKELEVLYKITERFVIA